MSEYEKYVAVREGAQNTASEDYFTPRASVDEKRFHTVFKAGFERAYDLQEPELTALRSERDAYKNALWKACGDDKEVVAAYLESVGFDGKEVK